MRNSFFLILFVICLFLTSCNNGDTESSTQIHTSEGSNMTRSSEYPVSKEETTLTEQPKNEQEIKDEQIIKKAVNKTSLERAITTSYAEKEILSNLVFLESDNFNTMLQNLDKRFPIEYMRTFDDTSLPYCVYKLNEGGHVFLFFHGNSLLFLDCAFVVKDSLRKSSFDVIKIGDTIAKVYEVDRGFKALQEATPNNMAFLQHGRSYHMVKEGFISIEYDVDTANPTTEFNPGTYRVNKMNFYPNGSPIDGLNYDDWNPDNPSPFQYTFLPDDYPQ